LISLIKENVARNPKILGTYIGWEKRTGPQRRGLHRRRRHRPRQRRFLPWWFRNEDGSLGLDKLADVDDQKTLSTGVRASEYYLCSKTKSPA
jgi:methyl-accepting chemotaxis protein